MFRRVFSTAVVPIAGASLRTLTYTPRVREFDFLFEDVFSMSDHYASLQKAKSSKKDNDDSGTEVNHDLVHALLEESARLAQTVLFPLYESGDSDGAFREADGKVRTPRGFQEAYKAFCEGGWTGLTESEAVGGQGLPMSVGIASREIMATGNWAFYMYPGLSSGAALTLQAWGSEEQKALYLPKLASGEWSGTMCLTEPQCGTDLAQVKAKAEPNEDGTYRITGTKIFISAGDHDLTSNIIHIVLARLPGSQPGTKGISLFLVPRNVVKADGSLEEKKNVHCIAVEKKMGIKASATCQLGFEQSIGYLIGKPNDGMKQMFTFMNGARLGTALEGVAHSELAFQNALRYARERGSMRALSGAKEPSKPNDAIIFHPNVRHNILFAKCIAEGGRAFILDIARMLDLQTAAANAGDTTKANAIDHEISFYTPIAKACLTEWGIEASSRALQVWGGHGYIKANGMEQILRDARIATIYEGTTGVQAMDFIGRKVLKSKTNEVSRFGARINQLTRPLLTSRGHLGKNARALWLLQKQWRVGITRIGLAATGNLETVGAASEELLMYTGYMVLGYYWLRMSIAAQKKIDQGKDADGFYQIKVDTCNFFFDRILPRTESHYKIMLSGADLMESKQEGWDMA